MPGARTTIGTAGKYDATLGGGNFPASTSLWGTFASLQRYDVVLLACEGNTFPTTKPATALKAMYDYANAGGRVFASHFHYYWVSANTKTRSKNSSSVVTVVRPSRVSSRARRGVAMGRSCPTPRPETRLTRADQ